MPKCQDTLANKKAEEKRKRTFTRMAEYDAGYKVSKRARKRYPIPLVLGVVGEETDIYLENCFGSVYLSAAASGVKVAKNKR